MTTFTYDTLMEDRNTQIAVQAMLDAGRNTFRPRGACSVYLELARDAVRAADQENFASVVGDAAYRHPAYFAEFLWNLNNIPYGVWSAAQQAEWDREEAQAACDRAEEDYQVRQCEAQILWNFLLGDVLDDANWASFPDMGDEVELLEGETFQAHSARVGEGYKGCPVLLLDCVEGGWKEYGHRDYHGGASIVGADHYYCMAIPVVGYVVRYDLWCFAPSMAGSPVIRYVHLVGGLESRYEGMADEPPIRGAVASRAKLIRNGG